MDALADLKARALKAREFTHTIGECEFTLRTPTRTEVRELTHERGLLREEADAMVLPLLQHYLLLRGIVGWTGVRFHHVLADAGRDPLPWSADSVAMLLDAQPAWSDAMGAALLASTQTRAEGIEADAKN
jgi:hypothetical protein